MSKNKKVLIVLTSHDELSNTGMKTGFWLEELAVPYYELLDYGAELTLASPKGGVAPMDPKSDDVKSETPEVIRFKEDLAASGAVAHTIKLSEVKAEDFDAVFYPGGHGPLWDLVKNDESIKLIENFWQAGKPVAAVCHAPIALINARDSDNEYIVNKRRVTGFTNEEETAVELHDIVPILVEDALIERGGNYEKKDAFESFAIVDGQLITGQNPASSRAVAKKLIEALDAA